MTNAVSRGLWMVLATALLWTTEAAAQEKIVIDGSSGVRPLAQALGEAFAKSAGGVPVEVGKGMGTKERLAALADGRIHIAAASHGLDAAELAKQKMKAHPLARVAVVFGVNADVGVASLTGRQICAIYGGEATNWKQLGGADMPIAALTRPKKEVDAEVIHAGIACFAGVKMAPTVRIEDKSGDMARALAATSGAIGMTTTTQVRRSKGKIKTIAFEGVSPSDDNVASAKYPFAREAYFVTAADPPTAVAKFLAFVRGPEGRAAMKANDAIPFAMK